MALSRTMLQLVGLCQRRADKESDDHVDTDEWKELISEVYGELHAVVTEVGARYFETEASITATGAATYALPSDHLSTIGVDRVVDAAGRRSPVHQLMVQEASLFGGQTGQACLFALAGAYISLYPTPSSGTYKHLYVPQPTDYSSASNGTSVDVINIYGLKFIAWGVASIAMHKGSDNQQRAVAERDAAKEELKAWAIARAITMPKRRVVSDYDLQYGDFNPASWRITPP